MDAETLAWILAAGLATAVGGLGLLLVRDPSERLLDGLLGFTAGIMLAATAFSLLVPALDLGSVGEVVAGFAAGGAVLFGLDRLVPHVHARFAEPGHTLDPRKRQAGLLLSALTIHNVPEGLAVGVAFAAGGTDLGVPIALAIGIQNIPEGFAAGAPLVRENRFLAAGIAALTGIVEPPAALIAFAAFEVAGSLLPLGLGFAAGAMLYVIVDELVPESHLRGHDRLASGALLAGFALMMTLDNALG
ncbi:MAG TPA: ZIP family metal transporter [Gaiellaceae bacterium]|nr:ZIP family metal transporter [Gaiellaceae bacterium]